jgi:hypothetical protein
MATVRHVTFSSGLKKISGRLIFVEQRVPDGIAETHAY